jgi:hypothetical protein
LISNPEVFGERFWLPRANRTLADFSPRGREVRFDHFGISDGRIQANNMDVVFHP